MRWFSLCLLCAISSGFAGDITRATVNQTATAVRVTLHFSQFNNYKSFALKSPHRYVLDLPSTTPYKNLQKLNLQGTPIKQIRQARQPNGQLRWVFDLETQTPVTIQTQSAGGQKLILDFKQKPRRDVIVVIDPGHGGRDPGAIGPHGTQEKKVVLDIAKILAKHINQQVGMRAVLTRHTDRYISLRKRLDIARAHSADLFISVHADAFNNPRSRGASIYALSQRGATSEAAHWLAEKENYSELGGVNLAQLDDDNGVLRSVLIDLSQTATIGSSLQLGSRVLDKLSQVTKLHRSKVEQARFVVLKSPDIPSLLIETGFISNPQEETLLKNQFYKTKLSEAVVEGIKEYFWTSPPRGTLIAGLKQEKSRAT